MSNKTLNIPPVYVANAAGNLLNCNITSVAGPVGYTQTQPYILVKRVRLVNDDTSARTVTLYKGATGGSAGGTEWGFKGISIPANSYVEMYCSTRFDAADFLSGVADAASKVTINIDAEIALS